MNRFATQLRRILVAEGLMPKTAAGKPYMPEITMRKYRAGEAFMAYFIDKAKNHSKFYEMVVIPDPYGMGATLKKKWGALGQGRQQDKVEVFADLDTAKRALARHGKSKLRKGYKDAFDSPTAKGQYPVGLDRVVGFGWGTQAITQCVPAMRDLSVMIGEALDEVKGRPVNVEINGEVRQVLNKDPDDLLAALEAMGALMGDIPDDMAKQVRDRLRRPLERMKQNPRYILDPKRTRKELKTLQRYIDTQVSECNI
jgi:predicted DNA-binding WGR domain protein